MKKLKKPLSIILSLIILMSMLAGINITSLAETSVEDFGDWRCEKLDDGTISIVKYWGSATQVSIPTEINNCLVTSIYYNAFSGCTSPESITIPDSITNICGGAFKNCTSLKSITIPDSVTSSIGDSTFSGCTSLESATIGNSVTSIGDKAFYECTSLKSVTIGNSVTFIGDSAFYYCISLESIKIPNSVSTISKYAFYDCRQLKSVTIPDSVTSIGESAFRQCKSLLSIIIPDGITSIKSLTFDECTSLENITIPDSLTSISYMAFNETAYYKNELNWDNNALYINNHLIRVQDSISGNVKIKSGTICIADGAFFDCTSLTSVIIPDSVTSIGEDAFLWCTSLNSVTIPSSVTAIGNHALGYRHNNKTNKYTIIDGFVIYGEPGSVAEIYADENSITFIDIADIPSEKLMPIVSISIKDTDKITADDDNKFVTIAMDGSKESLSAADFKSSLGNENVKIVDKDGNELESDALVGTGAKVQLLNESGNVVSEYEVIVPSDVNGDGKTTAADARSALRASARLDDIVGVYSIAADMSGDEKITAADARTILRKSANLE